MNLVPAQVVGVDPWKLLLIAGLAIAAHLVVLIVRIATARFLRTRVGSINKARTGTRFVASLIMFLVWFIAAGWALREIGVPLETYLASATVIGLAVSFGSQSLVQDVISGLTLIFTGLIDVGDTVEIVGQTGVVESIGIRYTELRTLHGAVVYIPNRNVANVAVFPKGYIRAFMDVRLPEAPGLREEGGRGLERAREIATAANHQFSEIMVMEPTVTELSEPGGVRPFARVKFRIWPGQGGVIESAVRPRMIAGMRGIDPEFQDWMVTVHYKVEGAFQRRAISALEFLRERRGRMRGGRAPGGPSGSAGPSNPAGR
ncbi:MAG: mechanosensitive ion channel domain-containing protein [Phycisphaerales bacterium]